MKLSELNPEHELALTFAITGFNHAVKKVSKSGALEPRGDVEKNIKAWEKFRDDSFERSNDIIDILKKALEEEGGAE